MLQFAGCKSTDVGLVRMKIYTCSHATELTLQVNAFEL